MKKLLTLILAVAWASSSFAALQYEIISTPGGNEWTTWESAQKLTIRVTQGGSIWLSRFADNWKGTITDLGTYTNMTEGNYGFKNTATGETTYGTGEMETLTFTKKNQSNTTASYYAGDFEAGDVLSFWVTTPDGRVLDSIADVTDPSTEVNSRRINQTDLAGNTRINFDGIEFILAGGEYKGGGGAPSGQPLPGVLATLLLGSGALVLNRRRKSKTA
mgnify:CR=1 FL=1